MLIALAEHADQSGYCFPSLQRLATMCEISLSTAHRMIKLLAARNLITIERRFHRNGSCRSNGYRLAITDYPANLTGWSVRVTGGKVSPANGHGVTRDRETTTEPVLYKEPLQPAHAIAPSTQAEPRELSSSGPLCFPREISEAQREAIRAQVALLNHHYAQQIIDELAGRMDTVRIRNPVGYCARLVERLKRGQFEPHVGLAVAKQRQSQQREQRSPGGVTTARMTINGALDALPERIRSSFERARAKQADEHGNDAPKTHS